MAYLVLILCLSSLALAFLRLPDYRLLTSILIGLSYFLWGVWMHRRAKALYWPVVLEYLTISLLAVTVLIFISLRV